MPEQEASDKIALILCGGDINYSHLPIITTKSNAMIPVNGKPVIGWIIDELKRVGCDTARSVLDLNAEELERRTDLEKETIVEVRKILSEEFEKE